MSDAITRIERKSVWISGCVTSKQGLEISTIYEDIEYKWKDIIFATTLELHRKSEESAPLLILLMRDIRDIYYINGKKINPRLFVVKESASGGGSSAELTELWKNWTAGNYKKSFTWIAERICSHLTHAYIDRPLLQVLKEGDFNIPIFSSLDEIADYCTKTLDSLSEEDKRGAMVVEISDSELKAIAAPTTRREEWDPGTIIENRYIVQKIFKGGMGIVYEIFDSETVKYYAWKTFQEQFLWDERIMQQFIQEAEIWVKLDRNPNIVQAELVKVIEGKPYIFLEYIQGTDLQKLVENGKIPAREALKYAIQFCNGMDYAFRKIGLVHRDIKPSNCMITRDGVLKITDFGLGKVFDTVSGEDVENLGKKLSSPEELEKEFGDKSHSRSATAIVGTLPFMAPELFDEKGKAGVTTDIYAFGLVLYVMLTGVNPLYSENVHTLIVNHLTVMPENPTRLDSSIPNPLGEITLRCLSKEPETRYQSFVEIKESLEKVYENAYGEKYILPAETDSFTEKDWINKGISLASLHRPKEALSAFEKALEIDTQSVDAMVHKGTTLITLDRIEDAIATFDAVKNIDRTNWRAWAQKGEALWRIREMNKALSSFQIALKLSGNSPEILWRKGKLMSETGSDNEALECFNSAIDKAPKDPEIWYERGCHLMKMKLYGEASDSFAKAIENNPRYIEAWKARGDSLFTLGHLAESIKAYEKVLVLDQESVATNLKIASCSKILGNTRRATLSYNAAIKQDPVNPQPYLEKSQFLIEQNQWEEALNLLSDAEKNNARSTGLLIQKARALYKLGYYKEVIALFRDTPDVDKKNKEAVLLIKAVRAALEEKNKITERFNSYSPLARQEIFKDIDTALCVFCDVNDAATQLSSFIKGRESESNLILQASLYLIAGRLDDADSALDKVLQINKVSEEAHSLREKISNYRNQAETTKEKKKGIFGIFSKSGLQEDQALEDWLKTAYEGLGSGDHIKTLKALDAIAEQHPQFHARRYLQGLVYKRQGDTITSADYFEKFLQAVDCSCGFYKEKALNSPRETPAREIIDNYEKWIGYFPYAMSSWIALIKYYLERGYEEKAQLLVLEVLERFSEDELIRQDPQRSRTTQGLLNLFLGRVKIALESFEAATEDGTNVVAFLGKARCLELSKRGPMAKEILESYAERENVSILSKYLLSNYFVHEKELTKAFHKIEETVEKNSKSVILACKKAQILVDRKKYAEFFHIYQNILNIVDYYFPLRELKSIALANTGKLDEALTDLENAMAYEPDNIVVLKWLALFYLKTGTPQKAYQITENLMKINDYDGDAHLLRGLALYLNGNYIDAITSLEQARTFRPYNPELLLFLGVTHYYLKNYELAEACFEEAFTMGESFVVIWLNRGIFYYKQGMASLALQYFEAVLRIDPENFPAWFLRSKCRFELDEIEESYKSIERALYFFPGDKNALSLKGLIEFKRGNYASGAECYTKITELEEGNETHWFNLGLIQLWNKNYEGANGAFNRALLIRKNIFSLIGKAFSSFYTGDSANEEKYLLDAKKHNPEKFDEWAKTCAGSENHLQTLSLVDTIDITFELPLDSLISVFEPITVLHLPDLDHAFK